MKIKIGKYKIVVTHVSYSPFIGYYRVVIFKEDRLRVEMSCNSMIGIPKLLWQVYKYIQRDRKFA